MCGILIAHNSNTLQNFNFELFKSEHGHRGPDQNQSLQDSHSILIHDRLSILDLSSAGDQPFLGCQKHMLIHNGEIYNHEDLKNALKKEHSFQGKSDSETILHLYEEKGKDIVHELDGVFFLAIARAEEIFVARDPIGVKSGYYGYDAHKNIYFASELKSLVPHCIEVKEFPPGHYYCNDTGFVRYYKPSWKNTATSLPNASRIREVLEQAVEKRMMADVEIGVFLSGGLDSSLIAAILADRYRKQGRILKTFSIGIEGNSLDHKFALDVAKHIQSEHHELYFTPEEAVQHLRTVIYHLETYDLTTIRSGIPLYLLSKKVVEQFGLKVVMCGEGSDELLGGYLYFEKSPSNFDFHKECVSRVLRLHTSDVLRVDKCTMANSLEARVPFLDLSLIKTYMNIAPSFKSHEKSSKNPRGIEKFILRNAFDERNPIIPRSVLWRQKEQFSDGVGYNWIDSLRNFAESQVSQEDFERRNEIYPHHTPRNHEEFLYRQIFEEIFDKDKVHEVSHQWIPKWQESQDPSGRHATTHQNTEVV